MSKIFCSMCYQLCSPHSSGITLNRGRKEWPGNETGLSGSGAGVIWEWPGSKAGMASELGRNGLKQPGDETGTAWDVARLLHVPSQHIM